MKDLHPLTLTHIEEVEAGAVLGHADPCGCEHQSAGLSSGDRWRLCGFHQGYEAAARLQQEPLDEAEGLLRKWMATREPFTYMPWMETELLLADLEERKQ